MSLGLGFGCCCGGDEIEEIACTACQGGLISRYWRIDIDGLATGSGSGDIEGCEECSQINGSYFIEIGVRADPGSSVPGRSPYGFSCLGSIEIPDICLDHYPGYPSPLFNRMAFGIMVRSDDSPLKLLGVRIYSQQPGGPEVPAGVPMWATNPAVTVNCLQAVELLPFGSSSVVCEFEDAIATATPITASEFGA